MKLVDLIDDYGKCVIPEGVTEIEDFEFICCIRLTAIEIPASVSKISECAFINCDSLSSIVISPDNANYKSINDCCLSKDGKNLIFGCKNSRIPDGVTTICCNAFSGCIGLTSIEFPNSVTTIEGGFMGCVGLTSVKIPDSVTKIGGGAFMRCSGLTSIEIPGSVIEIDSAFSECSGLTSIKIQNGVRRINPYAFAGCTGLTSIEIPDSVIDICTNVISGCSALTSITVSSRNPNYKSINNCCLSKTGDKLIFGCKTSIIPEGVTEICRYAFGGCAGLTTIEIPGSVTKIDRNAFFNCRSLSSIVVSDDNANFKSIDNCCLSKTGEKLIFGCKTSKIPDGVTEIEKCAFLSCDGLTSIEVPDSVMEIGKGAFSLCSGLTSIEIPGRFVGRIPEIFGPGIKLTSVVLRVSEKQPEDSVGVLHITDYFDTSIITLKVPVGCGDAYRHHPDFEGKFKEIQELEDL